MAAAVALPHAISTTSTATAEDITYCFRLLLNRAPSAGEWAGHASLIGMPLPAVVANYIESEEFTAIQRARTNEGVTVTHLPGYALYTAAGDLAVGHHVAGGAYQPELAAILRRHLRPGMSVLDVGANIGVFTLLAASLVGPSGHVVAIEPNLANVRLLEASRRLNDFRHVRIIPCAAGANAGMLLLRTAYSNGMTSPADAVDVASLAEAQLVPSLPLAALVPSDHRLDLIKIDIEGAEHRALFAFAAVLQRDRPVLVTEFSPGLLQTNSGVDGREYLHFLRSLHYNVAVILLDGTALPLARDDAVLDHLARAGSDGLDLLLTPD